MLRSFIVSIHLHVNRRNTPNISNLFLRGRGESGLLQSRDILAAIRNLFFHDESAVLLTLPDLSNWPEDSLDDDQETEEEPFQMIPAVTAPAPRIVIRFPVGLVLQYSRAAQTLIQINRQRIYVGAGVLTLPRREVAPSIRLNTIVWLYLLRVHWVCLELERQRRLLHQLIDCTSDLTREITDFCVVCQNDINPEQVVRQLRCSHVFHIGCVDPWLLDNATCPICRKSLQDMI